ncbi:DUF1735 and LamG domain-containing protein [Bacteroides finegoldii]|uniref:DUF1735 and LamG domain-containing protein n=1 Tax=Bacteroides finegoldii TaxID=338188 RepID=UPI00189E2E89|nr:DUF1735 and LamG domain-containing protein [Bacteroides finegoldii]
MKHILSNIVLAFVILLFIGCENAEYKITGNSIYLIDAAKIEKSSIIPMEDGADIQISVRLAQQTTSDVEIGLTFNPENIIQYNKVNGTEYQSIPENLLPKNVTITIPAGQISAGYKLHIDKFETNGITYAVPVELGEVIKGDIDKSNTQGKFIYILTKPLITSVPIMKGYGPENNAEKIVGAPAEDWGIQTAQWTLETWVRMDGFTINNQAIFNTGSYDTDEGRYAIYIRFGDANGPYNYLQVKIYNGQIETAKDLTPNTWYHFAFVFDGNIFTIYRNGIKDVSFTPASIPNVAKFDYLEMISSSARYFKNNCSMCQIRLWNVARTETEIANNMYYEVNATNPKLIGYWPMNEGSGNTFADITNNGHDLTADEHIIQGWEHNVKFEK